MQMIMKVIPTLLARVVALCQCSFNSFIFLMEHEASLDNYTGSCLDRMKLQLHYIWPKGPQQQTKAL